MAIKYIDVTQNLNPTSAVLKSATATITGITAAASAVVTAANDFAINYRVSFSGVVGMVEINNLTGTVSAASASSFTVNIASTGFTAYSSGGVATQLMNSPTFTTVRIAYDDTMSKQGLVDAIQTGKEAMVVLQ